MNETNIPDVVAQIPDTPQDVDLSWHREFDVEAKIAREDAWEARMVERRREAASRGRRVLNKEMEARLQEYHKREIEDLRHLYSMPPASRLWALLTGNGSPYEGYISLYKRLISDTSDTNLLNHLRRMAAALRAALTLYQKGEDSEGWKAELRAFAHLRWLQDCATSALYGDDVPAGHVVSAPLPDWCSLEEGPWDDIELYPREEGKEPVYEKDWAG